MKEPESRSQYIKSKAVEVGKIDGYEYWIVPSPTYAGNGFNGYIVFPEKPVRENGYRGIMTYVPVHGGITYANKDNLGMVYGFDTAHSNSSNYPISDITWVRVQIYTMLRGILKAKEVEVKYLKCITNKRKAKYAQMVKDIAPDEELNFGEMINLLSGKL